MISKEDIVALSDLARLKLRDGEAEALQHDINNILGYVGQVSDFAAHDAKAQKPVVRNIMREDMPRLADDPVAGKEEQVRAQFPTREGDYNVVRKIIQKDE